MAKCYIHGTDQGHCEPADQQPWSHARTQPTTPLGTEAQYWQGRHNKLDVNSLYCLTCWYSVFQPRSLPLRFLLGTHWIMRGKSYHAVMRLGWLHVDFAQSLGKTNNKMGAKRENSTSCPALVNIAPWIESRLIATLRKIMTVGSREKWKERHGVM